MPSSTPHPVARLYLLGTLEVRAGQGNALAGLGNQPKRLALLAYLALAPGGARRRDELLALFFPESTDAAARNALNQTAYRLRAVLGEAVLTGTEHELRLDLTRVWCDALEVRAAASAGDDERAVALYRGPLAPAFHARGVGNEFESWLAGERVALRDLAHACALRACDRRVAAGNVIGAVEMAHAAARLAPVHAASAWRLIELLERNGDRAGALRAFDEHARALHTELDLLPDPELAAYAARLRLPPPAVAATPPPHPTPVATMPPGAAPVPATRRVGTFWIGVAAVVAIAAVALGLRRSGADADVLAVGDIRMVAPADTTIPVELLLSTTLARVSGLSIITGERVHEVADQLRRAGRDDAGTRAAALEAGADEVIEGVLTRTGAGYRLDLRRVGRSGRSVGGHVVEAAALIDVIDLAAERIAADFGLSAAASRAAAQVASVVAYRLYEQGKRALDTGDLPAAQSLFRSALAEDTTFAMAAFQVASLTSVGREDAFRRARRLAARSPDRERLLITAHALQVLAEPSALAVAETLAARHPRDPEALMTYGAALLPGARYLDAIDVYRRAAFADSLSNYEDEAHCRACDARRRMRNAYLALDSAAAVEREARAFLRAHPESRQAWSELGQALELIERFEEAEQAFARGRGARYWRDADHMSGVWIRQGRFDLVDAHWADLLRVGDDDARKNAFWGSYISLRSQGRLEEALEAAAGFEALHGDPLLRGIALHDLGRYRESARIFEDLARPHTGSREPARSRNAAWHLAHAAASHAALRDTARLRAIEDSVRAWTSGSMYASDQRLYHYVRGLRLRAQDRPAQALREFDAALVSPFGGYVRLSLELGRAALATGDAPRAIRTARLALLGPVSAAGLYSSRTELIELLARAYDMNGEPDSAAAWYARAIDSWDQADPVLQPRVAGMRARVAEIQSPSRTGSGSRR